MMQSLKEIMNKTYQSTIDSNIDENGNVILDRFLPLRENEEIRDGLIYCTVCKESKIFVGIDWKGNKVARRCICTTCTEKEQQRLKEEKEKIERAYRIEKLKERSLIDERYKDKHFSDLDLTNPSFKVAYERCKKFCEIADEVLQKGYGIYLYGPSGTGKTVLTSCMANELIENEYTVLFTNFFEILKAIRSTFNKNTNETDDSVIDSIADVDVLFIDDLGTESLSKNDGDNFTQDKIFEIINKRYNKKKSTIFSSNYTIKELIADRNFMDKTVDRINGMSSLVLEIKGESYRAKEVMNEVLPF